MSRKSRRAEVGYEGEIARPRGPVIASVKPDAPRLMGFAQSLEQLGITEIAGEPIDSAAIEIGERIREARQWRGLSQQDLAIAVGGNQGDISNIERGKGKDGPSYRTLRNIAVALDVELPINRRFLSGSVIIRASTSKGVCETATSFDVLEPLFPRDHWQGVCHTIRGVFTTDANDLHSDTCYLIGVEPKTKVLLKAGFSGAIVSTLRRKSGEVHTHGARHRFKNPDPGEPLAILEEDGEVEVQTYDDDGMTLIMYPAQAIFARYCEDGTD